MEYSFDIEIAIKYGVNEAIIIKNLIFWIKKNISNEKHLYDGYYWTYNSIKAFSKLFPFWNERQIRHTLDKLEKQNIIKTGNYNKYGYDRTKWYTIIDKCICQICQIDMPGLSNKCDKNVKPIPDINTNNKKPDDKLYTAACSVLKYLNEKTGHNYKPSKTGSLKLILNRLNEGYTEDDCKKVIDIMCSKWKGTDQEEYLNYTTLFRPSNFPKYFEMKPKEDLLNGFRKDAQLSINYLNEKAKTNFSGDDLILKYPALLLKEGFTLWDLKRVIKVKVSHWKNDSEMKQNLRPQTLFKPDLFRIYMTEQMKFFVTDEDVGKIAVIYECKECMKKSVERKEDYKPTIERQGKNWICSVCGNRL